MMTSVYTMEKKSCEFDSVTSSTNKVKKINGRMVYIAIGTFVFLVIVGAVLLSVYFGVLATKDDGSKEYHVVYHNDDGSTEHQTVVVTNSEEEFRQEHVDVIANFETGLIVMKFDSPDFPLKGCLVRSFNVSDFQKPDEIKHTYKDHEIDVNSRKTPQRMSLETTNIWLNDRALGNLQRKLCDGYLTFFVREIKGRQDRTKREITKAKLTINLLFVKFEIEWERK